MEKHEEELIGTENTNHAKIMKQIRETERNRKMYTTFKLYLKPNERSGLTQVDILKWDKVVIIREMLLPNLWNYTQPIQWVLAVIIITIINRLTEWKTHVNLLVTYKRVVLRNEMEDALFAQHVEHFSQAEGILFTRKSLSDLGLYAERQMGCKF